MNKKVYILTILMMMFAINAVFSQTTTKKLSYQAVVRNADNELVVNQNLSVEITILNANNESQYQEMHATVPTNQNGLLWLWVGAGTPMQGTMDEVVWKDATIKSVFTLPDGSSVEQNTPVTAMPYAYFADAVDTLFLQDYLTTHDYGNDDYVTHEELEDTLNKYTTTNKVDTLLGAYAKTEDLAYYELQENLCGDVKNCIKDTLGKYTTTNQLDSVIRKYDYATNTRLTNDSTWLQANIDTVSSHLRAIIPPVYDNTVTITVNNNTPPAGSFTLNQNTDANVNIAVPTKISDLTNDSPFADTTANNHFTGNNTFTGTNIVPRGYNISGDNATNETNCGNIVVNACDLWAVFDSLNKRMDNILKTIDTLKHINDSLAQEIAQLKPSLTVTGPNSTQHLCDGHNTITFTATLTGVNADEYNLLWTVNGSAQSSTDTIMYYTPGAAGEYKVICTATCSGRPTLKDSATVNVSNGGYLPKFGICQEGRTVTVKLVESSLTTTVVWGDGIESVVESGDSHEYDREGNYTIIASSTAFGNCKLAWPVTITETTPNPCTVSTPHTNTSTYTATTGGLESVVNGKVVSVQDQDGHSYYVVQIGNQCWMRTNLRTSKYNDGTTIPGGANCSSYSTTDSYHYINSSYDPSCGYFYNWPAASHKNSSNQLNLCPKGWHVPSQEEWATLFAEAGVTTPKNTGTGAVYLAGGCAWENATNGATSVTPNSYENQMRDKWGFTALPAGRCWIENTTNLSFEEYGRGVYFWSSTEVDAGHAYDWYLGASYPGAANEELEKEHGRLVRCLRDEENSEPSLSLTASPDDESVLICSSTNSPALSDVYNVTYTATIDNDDASGYTFAWEINGSEYEGDNSGESSITLHWLTPGNQTVTCIATKGNSSLQKSVSLSVAVGVIPDFGIVNTTTARTVRLELPVGDHHVDSVAWGDNSGEKVPQNVGQLLHTYQTVGNYTVTAYSVEGCTADTAITVVDCASNFTCGVCQVKDADNNAYNTVLIGEQCWMKENLRSIHYSDGTTEISGIYNPGGNANNVATYGYLYTWNAVMNAASASSSNPSNVQGICPEGWHVPSINEFDEMLTTTAANSAAGKLATGSWSCTTCNNDAAPCNSNYEYRNSSGFSALPASFRDNGYYDEFGYAAYFWSSSCPTNDNAYYMNLSCSMENTHTSYISNDDAMSVRCVRDAESGGAVTDAPTVTTSDATNVSENGATLNGTVEANGNTMASQGFQWKATEGGTYTTINVSGETMTYNLSGLTVNTGYTYRAFATTSPTDTVYGAEETFTTTDGSTPCTPPSFTTCEYDHTVTVILDDDNVSTCDWGDDSQSTTTDLYLMDNGKYTLKHTYTNTGGYTLTVSYGGCSATSSVTIAKPTTLHPCAGTAHNTSAYQQNGYNGEFDDGFEVATNGGIISVEDYDGNVYSVTEINGQCWLAENLRCTHSPKTGNNIVINGDVASFTSKAAYWYYNMESMFRTKNFGLLYNWCAAMDTARPTNYIEVPTATTDFFDAWVCTPSTPYHRGICPKGWHLPSKEEIDAMLTFILDDPADKETGGGQLSYYHTAAKLAVGCDWQLSDKCNGYISSEQVVSCESTAVPGNLSYPDRNIYGFNAIPAGCYQGEADFSGYAEYSYFWSCTPDSDWLAWYFRVSDYNNCETFINKDRSKERGMSVRCLRDAE